MTKTQKGFTLIELMVVVLVEHSSIVNRMDLAGWNVLSEWSWFVNHLVDESDVCKRSTRHDFIIASASTVGVKIGNFDSVLYQELGSRGPGAIDPIGHGLGKSDQPVSLQQSG